jgi:hypothetical protein
MGRGESGGGRAEEEPHSRPLVPLVKLLPVHWQCGR